MSIIAIFYLISVVQSLSVFLIVLTIAIGILLVILIISCFVDYDINSEINPSKIKFLKILIASLLTVSIINCIVPDKLTMYSMVGIKYLSSTQVPEKVMKLVNMKLDEYIESQTKDKK